MVQIISLIAAPVLGVIHVTVQGLWAWSIPAALIGSSVLRRRPWLAIGVLPFALFVPFLALLQWQNSNSASLDQQAPPGQTKAAFLVILAACVWGYAQGGGTVWSRARELWGHLQKSRESGKL